MIITIDGPSSSGKTSISDNISLKTGFKILHSGLIYRAIARKIHESRISTEDEKIITKIASEISFEDLEHDSLESHLCGNIASKIAVYKGVREKANMMQHDFAKRHDNVIVEGRDAGTIVFPNANLKFYITADLKIRAHRRFKELQKKSKEVIYSDIVKDLKTRDMQDLTRKNAALKKADDAIMIDTSFNTKEEVINLLLSIIRSKL